MSQRIGINVSNWIRYTIKKLKEDGFVFNKAGNDFTIFSKVFVGVGAFAGTYQGVSIAMGSKKTDPYFYDLDETDKIFGAILGGATGTVLGLFWPVGIPIIIGYSLAKHKRKD